MVKFWRGRNIILAGGTMIAGIFGAQAVSADNSGISFTVSVPDVPVLEISVYDEDGNLMTDGQETLMEVTPTMALAGFNTTGMKVTVGTSSAAGYKLAMQVANDGTLVSENSDVIPSLASDEDESGNKFTCTTATAASCNFTVNSWGYWMTGGEADAYKPAPSVQTQLVNYTAGATDGEDTDFAFAVRANAKQAAGDYETTINFIATANPEITIHSLRYMQDFNVLMPDEYAAVVESMTEGQAYELTDTRDSATESYQVAKLEDGNVWMLDNLRLGGSSAITLKPSDTNITSDYSLPASVSSGFTDNASGRTVARINTSKKTTTESYGSGSNKIGVYYNYCAVSAGTICMDSNSNSLSASVDICPAGWRLPTGGPSGEFAALTSAIVGETSSFNDSTKYSTFKEAFHASLSGSFYDSSASYQSSYGYFWSSTYGYSTGMYLLLLNTSTVDPHNSGNRRDGFSVRCVLKENENNVAINFNGNGATSGKNRTLGYKAGSATLPNAEIAGFANPRHAFLGWNTAANGSGTSYAAGTTITAEMNGITLYAQWQEATLAMQDADPTSLGNLLTNNGDITYLYDNRDDNVYTIGKLNGKYWMLDNLALGGSSAMTLTGEDTNLATTSTTYILPASGTVCFVSGSCTGTAGSNNTNTTATKSGNGYTVAAINADYKTTTSANGNNFTYNSNGDVSKAGVYYNYCAASAGTYCYAANVGTGNASYDICPKGWRLPTGGSNANTSEFRALANNLGNVTSGDLTSAAYTNFKAAFHAGLSGTFSAGSALNQAYDVYFWSSTNYNGNYMYDLTLNTSAVNPQNSFFRYSGYSVRCVYGG